MTTEITIELDGESEHQLEYIQENTVATDGETEREVGEDELAKNLIREALLEKYVKMLR